MNKQEYTGLEIAVVGMACKFPGAKDVHQFWENLKNGVESISTFSDEELREYNIPEKDLSNPSYVKAKGLVEGAEFFDAKFFGFSPKEANELDPQFRVLSQCAYHALEDSGYDFNNTNNKVGVFVGAIPSVNWQMHSFQNSGDQFSERLPSLLFNDKDFISTRLSYLLNLQGTSSTVYTACSTSLVSIDMACQSLLTGKSNLSLAGGVALSLPYKSGYTHEQGMVLSKDGHTNSFDVNATGTIWSDGAGIVVLKRLEDALADGDSIHAVIKGTATNNDGNRKIGYTAPSVKGQVEVIKDALMMAEVPGDSIGYIEGHGSATALGDKIEISALSEAFKHTGKDYKCPIGSVKSNVGHLNAAAGIAGFIKGCLMLKNAQIPPSINFNAPNSKLEEKDCSFFVSPELSDWKNENYPLRMGVSSFGIGGTNAHVILEKAENKKESTLDERDAVICFSAKTTSGVDQLSKDLLEYATNNENLDVSDLAYTLQTKREHFKYRRAFVVRDRNELIQRLTEEHIVREAKESSVTVMTFPGMGGFYPTMGKDLYLKEPAFKSAMDECLSIIESNTGRDCRPIILGNKDAEVLKDFQTPQLLVFSYEYSLAILMKSWGIDADSMAGYSLGEYVAACLSGVFNLETALKALIERGRLMNRLDDGKMIAVPLSAEAIGPYLKNEVSIAVDNGQSVVLAGHKTKVEKLKKRLRKDDILIHDILEGPAGHTTEMNPIKEEFKSALSNLTMTAPREPMVSNVTGNWCDNEFASPDYWVKHLSQKVKFFKALNTLVEKYPSAIFLELGVGNFINILLRRIEKPEEPLRLVNFVRSENQKNNYKAKLSNHAFLMRAIASFWEFGGQMDWNKYHEGHIRQIISLPNYPFEKVPYNIHIDAYEAKENNTSLTRNQDLSKWFYVPSWKKSPLHRNADEQSENSRNILLLDFKSPEALVNTLNENNNLIVANYAKEFKKISSTEYYLDYNNKESIQDLFKNLESDGFHLDSIIDFTSIQNNEEKDSSLGRTVNLVQSLNETSYANTKIEYFLMSNNLFDIYGNEKINVKRSTIISAVKVIPQENSNINCRLIEIEESAYASNNTRFYKLLNSELYASDKIISYRGFNRWNQSFEQYPIVNSKSKESYIEKNGTYIIVGGLGDVGYTIAGSILENFECNVILVGRSEVPGKSSREEWLSQYGPNDSVSKKIHRIQRLEEGIGNVCLMQADSTSYEQMNVLVGEVKSKYGDVNGIFYAAGDVGGMSLDLVNNISTEQLHAHLPSKILGLSVLQKIVENNTLDFTMVLSSASSIIGGIGMIGYAAGNQYVDSLILKENASGNLTKWMSINYTYLNKEEEGSDVQNESLTEEEEGRKNFEKLFSKNNNTGNTSINYEESRKIFERLLSKNNDENQIVISPVYFPSLVEKLQNPTEESNEKEDVGIKVRKSRPITDVPYVQPTNDLEQRLSEIWEGVFGFEVGLEDDFFQLGGDSLGIIRLISNVQRVFDVSIEISEVFKDTSFKCQLNLIKNGAKRNIVRIEKALVKEYYAQSEVQKSFFILNQMNPELLCYNNLGIIKLEGEMDFGLYENLFDELIQEHDILRTSFHVVNGEAVQKVHDNVDFSLQLFDDEDEDIDAIVKKFHKPFDLEKPRLIRAGICKRKDNAYCVITDIHHIILDRVTFGMIIEDFQSLHNKIQLTPSEIKYVDFAEWQQTKEYEILLKKQEEFWLNEFKTVPESLKLPTDFPRAAVKNYNASSVKFELTKDEHNKLLKICQAEKITMYTLMLTTYYVLLSKLSNQEDIVIGTTVLGRQHEDLEEIMGVFAHSLPIRCRPDQQQSFKEFLYSVKNSAFQCFANEEYPFEKLVSKLDLTPDLHQNPLFDVMFEYYNFPEPKLDIPNADLLEMEMPNITSEFDFCMRISGKDNGKDEFNLDYRTDLYKRETIERFVTYFRGIIDSATKNIDVKLCDIAFLPENEEKLLLQDYNETNVNYEKEENLVTLFERQVVQNPKAVATVYEGVSLSYSELNERSNQVANYLISKGIVPGTTVGLLLERSLDMIIGILGVLKAGAGYLPLDPNLPEQRIGYMLDKSRSSFLLTKDQFLEQYTAYLPVQTIDSDKIKSQVITNARIELSSEDLAYCIFTSGSSGKPKGVMMNQRSVVNLIKGLEERVYGAYGNKKIRVALLASFSFDASVQQIFGSLLQGHSLYIIDDDSRKDGAKLRAFYNTNKIDLSDGTPTHLRLLVNGIIEGSTLESLSSWILAGEVLSKDLVLKFHSLVGDKVQLYNFYGPTEACVDSTSYKIDIHALEKYESIPIGKPLPNERVFVTDFNGNLVPVGVIGELCIAGDGLAQRYVGDESLTSQKFNSDWIEWEERVYRTGDLVKWLPDGNLSYHGRMDDQVKVRGYRIELSEIMNQLNTHPEIDHSIVVIREEENEKQLIAYYESTTGDKAQDIRAYLELLLPNYMVPSHFVHMEQLPLTVNGKVDKNQLPDFEVQREENHVVLSTETELKLSKLWSEVLNIDQNVIGKNSSFFDLGGNSLSLVFLKNKILETFNVLLSLKELILLRDIGQQGIAIETGIREVYSRIPVVADRAYYPLSSSQKRLYFLNEFDKEAKAYNQPQCFMLKGIIDQDKLTNVFEKVIARHDSLRTRFELKDGEPVQYIAKEAPFELEYHRSTLKKSATIISNFVRPFNLEEAPLLRIGLIRISKEKHIMMFDMHHIISDGISIGIFIKDIMAIYQEQALAPLRLQYKDYAVWQQGNAQEKNRIEDKKFWKERLTDLPSALELPTDRARPKVISYQGNAIEFTLGSNRTKGLNNLAKTYGVTSFSVLLGVYKILLYRLTGQEDLIVGTSVAGRNHADIADVMGVFLNSLPLRNKIVEKDSFADLLLKINENALASFEHQDYPYEELIGDLNLVRDTSRNPLFDVMFEYANFEQPKAVFPDLELLPYGYEYNISKFDLTLHANEREGDIEMDFQYSTDLFDYVTMKNFTNYFTYVIDQVISDAGVKVESISLLRKEEIEEMKKRNTPQSSFKIKQDIVSQFESYVQERPSRMAISFGESWLSYNELNERSNQVAAYLIAQGIERGEIVSLILDRSLDMIIGILGVLKSGGAYLPIDPNLPSERIEHLLRSSDTKLLLGHERHLEEYETISKTHNIETIFSEEYSKENPVMERSSSDLAYCIYTSGSTGVPKGVLMEHKGIINLVGGLSKTVYEGLGLRLRVALLASYSFDASCQQIFGALLQGHSLFISEEEQRMDGLQLFNFYKDNAIEVSDGTPTHFGMFLSSFSGAVDLPHLKRWLLAGESLPKELARDFFDRLDKDNVVELYNLYGPTESCVDSTYYRVDSQKLDNYMTIPIGNPLPNEQVHIVDRSGNYVPQGVVGELCISGNGLARGYVDKKDEENRFVSDWIPEVNRVYRTGDLARWLPNGNLEYRGRMDNQIKLRGYRVELGEVEHVLLSHTAVIGGAVILTTIEDEVYLSAYYVSEQDLEDGELREHLLKALPEYMVPSFYVRLDNLPVTSNGKLDRQALPSPDTVGTANYLAPSNENEERLLVIWSEVLKLDPEEISVTQNFLELGGHSLKAIQIANKIKKDFGVEMKLAEIFQRTTIVEQAQFIDANQWLYKEELEETDKLEINI